MRRPSWRWVALTVAWGLALTSIGCRAGSAELAPVADAVEPAAGAAAQEDSAPFDPSRADIPTLRAALDAGRISCEGLVRYYLDRIARLDRQGPRVNALITLNPRALDQARMQDREGVRGKGLLYGIPFVAKDNYDSAGLPTTAGSAALAQSVPTRNAFVLQRLLDAGAILLGKANMSELAASNGRFGYSSAGGLTSNPYDLERDASGSSSGSAAAVAADFAPFALGTDTSGSIRGPASVTGLVGLRPTLGLTSRSGVVPLSSTADTTGALTRTVADQAIVLDAMAGHDPDDAATLDAPAVSQRYYSHLLGTRAHPWGTRLPAWGTRGRSLRGVRIGVVLNFRGGNDEVDAAERAAYRILVGQGAQLVPVRLPPVFEDLWNRILGPVGDAEFKPEFERYLRQLPEGGPRTLAQVIAAYDTAALRDGPTPVNPARLEALRRAEATELTDSPTYIRVLTELIPEVRRELERLVRTQRLDAFAFATMSCPASPRFDRTDPSYQCRSEDPYRASYIAAAAGFPEISVPMGQAQAQVPLGLSFLGLRYGEAGLLAIAQAFERARPALRPARIR